MKRALIFIGLKIVELVALTIPWLWGEWVLRVWDLCDLPLGHDFSRWAAGLLFVGLYVGVLGICFLVGLGLIILIQKNLEWSKRLSK